MKRSKTVLQLNFGPYSPLNPSSINATFLYDVFGVREVDDEYFMTITSDQVSMWTDFFNKNQVAVKVVTIHEGN